MDPKRGCWRNQAQTNTGAHTQVLTKGKSSCNEDPTDCCSLTKPLLHRWSLGWTIGLLLWPGDGTALHIVGMCFMYAVNWNSYCSSGKVVSFVHTRHWKALHPPLQMINHLSCLPLPSPQSWPIRSSTASFETYSKGSPGRMVRPSTLTVRRLLHSTQTAALLKSFATLVADWLHLILFSVSCVSSICRCLKTAALSDLDLCHRTLIHVQKKTNKKTLITSNL